MNGSFDSSDRPPSDYALFALGFVGVMSTAYGLALTSVPVTVMGLLLLAFAVGCFLIKSALSSD